MLPSWSARSPSSPLCPGGATCHEPMACLLPLFWCCATIAALLLTDEVYPWVSEWNYEARGCGRRTAIRTQLLR
jgi:hypothetical protein